MTPVPDQGDAEACDRQGCCLRREHLTAERDAAVARSDAAEAEAARLLRVADDQHVKHMKALAEVARLREALGACAANIEETGEWGMDALAKTRAALAPPTQEPGT